MSWAAILKRESKPRLINRNPARARGDGGTAMTQTAGASQHPARHARRGQQQPAIPGLPLDDYEDEDSLDAYVKGGRGRVAPAHR